MKIRLREIEPGSGDTEQSKLFYQSVLGLQSNVDIAALNVFNCGTNGVDFNTSTHLTKGTIMYKLDN